MSCRSLSAKEPLIIGLFLQKMTSEDKASYDSTPPCVSVCVLSVVSERGGRGSIGGVVGHVNTNIAIL